MPKISEDKRGARRRQILDAARRCFQRDGLHRATMVDIIAASGLSAGAVYLYFQSKDEMIRAAVVDALDELSRALTLALNPPPSGPGELAARAAAVIDGLSSGGVDLRGLALLGWSEAQRDPELKTVMEVRYRGFRRLLAEAAEAWRNEGTASGDADVVAKTLLSLLLGYVVQAALLGDMAPSDLAGLG